MYRIVIADDEEYTRDLLAQNINRSQKEFRVVGKARDGEEAFQLVKELEPDILITDICMPIVDGLKLICKIRELNYSLKTVIISGYDDFAYAKRALTLGVTEYLLKPFSPDEVYEVLEKIKTELENQRTLMNNIQEMKDKLEDSRQIFQEQVVKELVQKARFAERTDLAVQLPERAKKAGMNLHTSYCTVGVLRIYSNLKNREQDMTGFLAVIKDTYFNKKCSTYITRINEKQIIILFLGEYHNSQSFTRDIREGLSAICDSMEKYYDLQANCVIGGIYQDWRKIHNSYEEALSVWHGILKRPETVVFYEEEVLHGEKGRKDALERPFELEQQLLIHIQMGRKEKAEESLYEILRYYESMNVQSSGFVSISLLGLVIDISGTLTKVGGQGQVWEDENVAEYLKNHFSYGSLQEAQEVLQAYVLKCCERFEAINEKQGDRIVSRVKELIEKNLSDEEFNLETASAMLYFSHNYVRQIFKQITGESFMEYLIRRRMERARELLKNESYKIQEVASQTGYSNQRYFASCFKKYYGYTPTEYRNRLKEEI